MINIYYIINSNIYQSIKSNQIKCNHHVVATNKKVIQKIKINSDKKIKIKPKIKLISANANAQADITVVNNL